MYFVHVTFSFFFFLSSPLSMCVVVCLLSTDCRNAQKNLQLNVAFFFYIIFKNTISNSIRVLRLRGGGGELSISYRNHVNDIARWPSGNYYKNIVITHCHLRYWERGSSSLWARYPSLLLSAPSSTWHLQGLVQKCCTPWCGDVSEEETTKRL